MSGILIGIVFFVSVYTVFAPILMLDVKHLKTGLFLLFVIGLFALMMHFAGQL